MATSCSSYFLTGMGKECAGAVAGVKRLIIGLANEWNVSAGTAQTITALSGKTTGATLYDYYIADESTSLTSTLNVNNANGVKYYENICAATFNRLRPDKHLELVALANERLILIAVDNNNQSWFLGFDGSVTATEETAQTGQSFDDLSGYQVTFSQRSATLPYGIDESLYSGKVNTPDVYEN